MPVRRPSRRRFAATTLALLLALVAAARTTCVTGAAEEAALAPGTIVSNDGRVFPAAPLSALESPPFHGLGALPEGMGTEIIPPHPDAIPHEIALASRARRRRQPSSRRAVSASSYRVAAARCPGRASSGTSTQCVPR